MIAYEMQGPPHGDKARAGIERAVVGRSVLGALCSLAATSLQLMIGRPDHGVLELYLRFVHAIGTRYVHMVGVRRAGCRETRTNFHGVFLPWVVGCVVEYLHRSV